ncbi:ABC transporter permease [Cryptosporangium aurantiacum]|uniref:Putative spermidine/putrescine transport system permease protein n=1 Tax=Cryptosporangium aurantiacum TaxID=134849 RepID=A0A1M7RMJ4_9ACTN|nr:ABC transporter permease [Cryptosporangium aurantiacum]SHN47555.1 putative spermidine/putrescine transport system permease protein [Cryptosporangium aurantiacum]
MTATLERRPPLVRRVSTALYRRPKARLGLLLSVPLLWLGLAYLGALAALFVAALWSVNDFTGQIVRAWTFENFTTLFTGEVYRTITLRTIGVAVGVTVIDAVIALPVAFYMAKIASPRAQRWLVVAILTPLWASYLVKVYAWRLMFSGDGILSWFGGSPGYGLTATTVTLAYLWLPYMILPIYAGLERLPDSLLDAAGDLGARPFRSFRTVVLPTIFPAVVAGSIFTFSLSLGDYITVRIVGGTKQLLGNVVYDNIGAANNLPFAAAVATVPVVIMLVYLAAVRRTGALENL